MPPIAMAMPPVERGSYSTFVLKPKLLMLSPYAQHYQYPYFAVQPSAPTAWNSSYPRRRRVNRRINWASAAMFTTDNATSF